MITPWINVDAGELEDEPLRLYAAVDAVNVACGGHAGDAHMAHRVLDACAAAGTRVGAHPGYPDRTGFGRRTLALPADALQRTLREQTALVAGVARRVGIELSHLKLHGALYHDANQDPALARVALAACFEGLGAPCLVVGPRGGALEATARVLGAPYAVEGFADRRMRPDGSLVPRSEPEAILTNPADAVAQALRLAATVDTLCVHGDTPRALELVEGVARALREQGLRPR